MNSKIEEGQNEDVVWIADIIPGDARSEDITNLLLKKSFVWSANRPYSGHVVKYR
jgi:hypothetical protein